MTHLVLLPGLASDAELWRDQIEALAPLYALSVTDVHARHDSLPDMARALLDEHPGDLLLCGTSMGGILALEVVRQAPGRVKALALLGTTARPESAEMRVLREGAIVLFEQGRMDEVLQANVPLAFHPDHAGDPALVERYLAFVRRAGAQQLVRQNRAIMARADSRPLLPMIDCPTLVMCGEADVLTPPELSREIAASVPGARLHMLARSGHLLTMEQPRQVNETLGNWLAGVF